MADLSPTDTQAQTCPLCLEAHVQRFIEIECKRYWRCDTCQLTYLDAVHRLPAAAEHRHYLSHENNVDDPGYRSFLARLADPLLLRLPAPSQGLDYGCGPGPALAHMLREQGHQVALYDPFFATDKAVLAESYEFVTCTEVAEHFHRPASEFALFAKLLKPGGWLGLMTSFQTDDSKFPNWHYRRDPTHVAFYKRETLSYVARRLGWCFVSPAKDIVLMRKPL